MQISHLNPIGYEARTDNGNKYKKTNLAKTVSIASFVGFDALPYIFPKKLGVLKPFSTQGVLASLGVLAKFDVKKYAPFIVPAGFALDAALGYFTGKSTDDAKNKVRAQKADEQAEHINTNA